MELLRAESAALLGVTDATALNERGIAQQLKGETDRAIGDFDAAITLDQKLAAAFNNRGIAYASLGQYDRALTDYEQAVRLAPDRALAFCPAFCQYGIACARSPASV